MASDLGTILIVGASGNNGAPLVKRILSSSQAYKLILPTRSRSKLLSNIGVSPGSPQDASLVIPEGDAYDPLFFETLLKEHSVATVVLTVTGPDELMVTLNAFDAMRRPGTCVKRLIYISAAGDFSPEAVLKGALKSVNAGHVAVKFVAEQALAHGGPWPFTWTVLGPTLFVTNDLRNTDKWRQEVGSGSDVLHFDAPHPDIGVSRVDTEDIALAAFNVIKDRSGEWNGQKIDIGSRRLYTSSEIGKAWGDALGKKVVMPPNTLEYLNSYEDVIASPSAWGNRILARDHMLMFDDFFKTQFPSWTDEGYQKQVELLGKEPTDYEAWVKEAGKRMKKEIGL